MTSAFHPPLAYVSRGSGPALLMLQGVGLAGGAWRPRITELRHPSAFHQMSETLRSQDRQQAGKQSGN